MVCCGETTVSVSITQNIESSCTMKRLAAKIFADSTFVLLRFAEILSEAAQGLK